MRKTSRSGSRDASRAAVSNEIILNAQAGETRVAILEQGVFTELHIERERERNVAGTVSLGRVTRVLPGMQAAFVDIGLEKAAFLYVGDYLDESGQLGDDVEEDGAPRIRRSRGRNGSGRPPPRIDTLLSEGQQIVVQVAKEPIGTKGARITSHVSIAGRHIVLTPWAQRVGVSRQISSDRERRRLRDIVARVRPPELGFIIRTAGEGARSADIEADVKYLTSVWNDIQLRRETARAPAALHTELSLPLRVIRDVANTRTKRIVIDDEQVYEQMKEFLSRFVADPKPKLEHYTGAIPLFDDFDIERCIDQNLGTKVWLKSGGHLVVDQSEALTAIDVNTGRFVGKRDLEETVLKTNLEAVKEVVHLLRFRNIGGLIIIDLIDMESSENREKVYRALHDALRQDKARTNILKISELGLVEMTRKRTRENLVQQLCESCSYCQGRGYILSSESVAYKLLREIRKDLPRFCGREIAVSVNPDVAEMLLGPARPALTALSLDLGREIEVRARHGLHQEQFEVTALDSGPPVSLSISWLQGDEAGAQQAEGKGKTDGEADARVDAEGEAGSTAPVEAEPPGPPTAAETLTAAPDPPAELAADAGQSPEEPAAAGAAEWRAGDATLAGKPGASAREPVAGAGPHPSPPEPQALDVEAEKPILRRSVESEEA
ncbi:MAG: Rne/Rng family ribonuclease [Myxococcales bacterium]|nr:Rne/Rng family ribonuclease [Myxococcales bacterium]